MIRVTIVSVPTSSSPAPTSRSPAPTSRSPAPASLIAGLSAGLVIGIAGILTCIAPFVVFMRQRNSSTSIEQPFHDHVAPSRPPTQPERIEVEENDAYGVHPPLTSSTSSLQSNAAYETSELEVNDACELHSGLNSASPSLQSNAAYGVFERIRLEENNDCDHSELTSSLQSNLAYEFSPSQADDDAV